MANFIIMLLQIGVGLLTGSVAMISDGIHTITDLLSTVAAWLSVRVSARPADSCHPWGHGKFENLAALGQGFLILISAVVIGWEAIKRLMVPRPLEVMEAGILVTVIAVMIQIGVSWRMWKVGKRTQSPALSGSALHMFTDVASSLAVLLGLVVTRFWGILIADALAALAVTVMIGAGGIKLIIS